MNSKKTGSLLLTAIMVILVLVLILTATPVSAEEIYNWEQVSEEGFGDLTNDYAWSMATYTPPGESTEYLYVGTLNFNYSEPPNLTNDGCEAYRTNGTIVDGKYVWEQVVGPNGTQLMIHPITGRITPATAGFGWRIPGIHNMIVHDGLLWASCFSPLIPLMIPEETATGFGTIWITNGTHWKRANIPGFGHRDATIRAIAVFNDELYAGTMKAGKDGDGANIYKYTGGPLEGNLNLVHPAAWTRVFSVTADEAYAFADLKEFNGYLYAFGMCTHGIEIYRSRDGTRWREVVGDAPGAGMPRGFGDDSNIQPNAVVFQDELYVGTQNFEDHAEIWRTSDGLNWEPVELYGFGRNNIHIYRVWVYDNKLIVGTKNFVSGCEVWMSETGDPGTFEQINIGGMDGSATLPPSHPNSNLSGADQDGVRSFVANYQGYLIAGTSTSVGLFNETKSSYVGCEIWRINGTTYDLPKYVDVNKTVWDSEAQEWVHEMEAHVNDAVRFRCEIRNIGSCNLTDIIVWNSLSVNLEYADNATIDPARNYTSRGGSTSLEWDLPYLSPGESVVIEYDADVVKCNGSDLNHLYARGYCEDNDRLDDDWDMVIVNPVTPSIALVVGIADYPGEKNDLPNFTNEAIWVRDYLESLGYSVTMLTDAEATKENVTNALNTLVSESDGSTPVVFHYNGLGTRNLKNIESSGMYLHDDVLWSSEMKRILAPMEYKQFLLVFDCGMPGHFAGGGYIERPWTESVIGPNRVVVTASFQRRAAFMDPETGWGVFGKAFWKEGFGDNAGDNNPRFGNQNGLTSAEEAFMYAKTRIGFKAKPRINDRYTEGNRRDQLYLPMVMVS